MYFSFLTKVYLNNVLLCTFFNTKHLSSIQFCVFDVWRRQASLGLCVKAAAPVTLTLKKR